MIGRICILYYIFLFMYPKNSSSEECDCKPLRACMPFLRLLRGRTENITNLTSILSRECGWENNFFKVCCPKEDIFAQQSYFPSMCGRSATQGSRLHGGSNTRVGEFPWATLLGYILMTDDSDMSFLCGGAILNKKYIISAAHCIDIPGYRLSHVRIGEHNISTPKDCTPPPRFGRSICSPKPIDISIEEAIKHYNYNKRSTYSDDIALIRLKHEIDFSYFGEFGEPICFPPLGFLPQYGFSSEQQPTAIGWGQTELKDYSDALLRVIIPFINNTRCERVYRFFNTFQICAGGVKGKDTCMGDSGGPLMLDDPFTGNYLLIGIISYGEVTCKRQLPAVYTSVSEYRDWLEVTMKPW